MPSADATPQRDIVAYERAYAGSGFESVQAGYRKRLLLELLDRQRPRRVLEVGCGLDTLANYWTDAERFVIVEPGARFASEARRCTAGRADVEVVEDTLEGAVGQLRGDFDLILLSSLLHEVVDGEALLAATRELAGTTALVHVNVPNARSFHRLLALEMGLLSDVQAISGLQQQLQQHRTFDLDTLAATVEAQGFDVVETGSYFVKPFTHAQMQQLLDEGFLSPQMLDGLWGLTKHLPGAGSEIFVNVRVAGVHAV